MNRQTRSSVLKKITKTTFSGFMLFLIVLMLGASAYKSLRVEMFGALVHPYLIPLGFIFLFLGLPRIRYIPQSKLLVVTLFVAAYLLTISDFNWLIFEGLKMGGALVTALTAALLIRSKKDFQLGVLAMNFTIAFLALQVWLGLGEGFMSLNPMEDVGNKNIFSLYALPAILLGGYLMLQKDSPKWQKIILLGCIAVTIGAIFMGGNRSGWLGIILIGVMLWSLTRHAKIRSVFIFFFIASFAYYLIVNYGVTEALEHRWAETIEGNQSDEMRLDLIKTAIQIGFENPLLGVSPNELPNELSRKLRFSGYAVDPHNVMAHFFGGSGVFVFLFFLFTGWVLWRKPRSLNSKHPQYQEALSAHLLLRMLLILWVLRGCFTREVLYSPGFAFGIGLSLGWCLVCRVWARS